MGSVLCAMPFRCFLRAPIPPESSGDSGDTAPATPVPLLLSIVNVGAVAHSRCERTVPAKSRRMLRLNRVLLLAALSVASLLTTADGFSNSALRLARRPLLPLVNTKPLPRIRPATLGPILMVSLTAPIGIMKVGGAVLKAYLVLLDTAPLLTKAGPTKKSLWAEMLL